MEIQSKEAITRCPIFSLKADDIIDDSLVLQLEKDEFIDRIYKQ